MGAGPKTTGEHEVKTPTAPDATERTIPTSFRDFTLSRIAAKTTTLT